MGKVTHGQLYNRRIAVKHLSMHHFELNEEYMKDLRTFGTFDYDYLIKIEGIVTKSYPDLIVMEYMEHGTLGEYCDTQTGFDLAEALRDIIDGIGYCHLNRFILRHLDQNHILVTSTNGKPIFKLRPSSKYYLAQVSDEPEVTEDRIDLRQVSPEVIQTGSFSSEGDIWSFGILMWSILSTNEEPYWGLSNQQVLNAVTGGWRLPKPNCEKISESLNNQLHQIMLQCWEDHPSGRPSAKEIQFKIEKIINQTSNIPGIPV